MLILVDTRMQGELMALRSTLQWCKLAGGLSPFGCPLGWAVTPAACPLQAHVGALVEPPVQASALDCLTLPRDTPCAAVS